MCCVTVTTVVLVSMQTMLIMMPRPEVFRMAHVGVVDAVPEGGGVYRGRCMGAALTTHSESPVKVGKQHWI